MKNATRTTVAVVGLVTGLGGIEHGIGEMLQGSVAPPALVFESWPGAAAFSMVSGEPAMSLIPNLLVSGALTVLVSLAFLAWVVFFAQRRRGWLVMLLLSAALLLVGGGFGPPLLGFILSAAAARTHSGNPGGRVRRWLGRLWPWSLGACMAAWLAMLPGMPLLYLLWGIRSDGLVMATILAMFSLLFLAIAAASARDSLAIDAQPATAGL